MLTTLKIPILPNRLGVTELGAAEAQKISSGLATTETRLPEIIGALINIHKTDIHDSRTVRDTFHGMEVSLCRSNGDYKLLCQGVPSESLYDGENVIWQSVEQISCALRDLIFAPKHPPQGTPRDEVSAYVKKFSEHSGFLYRGERGLVMFTWGGHRVPREEYEFAKQIGYWLALFLPDMENITGCGTGIMKAPFKGAQVAYGKQRSFHRFGERDFIGFSEKAILTAEAPNELVNRLIVYPVIEARMEAFIRASHRGKVHPGGPGTIEEIMTMLALLSMPENKDVPFAFEMVEKADGVYFKELVAYLKTCFGNELDDYYKLFLGHPRDYARYVAESTRKLSMRYLWNDAFTFAKRLQEPFEVNFESMEQLDLSRNQEPFSLLINLRRFFSAIVHISVKDQEMLDSWGTDRPLIKGDKDIVRATDALVRKMEKQGRIHPNRKYVHPYRTD